MVNLRYLVQVVHSAINEGSSNVVRKRLYLSNEDINFLESRGCLNSIKTTDISNHYSVELNRNQLLLLCH